MTIHIHTHISRINNLSIGKIKSGNLDLSLHAGDTSRARCFHLGDTSNNPMHTSLDHVGLTKTSMIFFPNTITLEGMMLQEHPHAKCSNEESLPLAYNTFTHEGNCNPFHMWICSFWSRCRRGTIICSITKVPETNSSHLLVSTKVFLNLTH